MRVIINQVPLFVALLITGVVGLWLVNTALDEHSEHQELLVLREVLQVSGTAVGRCDTQGRFKTWPKGAEALLGYSASEMIGQPIDVIVGDDSIMDHQESYEVAVRASTGRPQEIRCDAKHKDGSWVPVRVLVWVINGQANYFMDHADKVKTLMGGVVE